MGISCNDPTCKTWWDLILRNHDRVSILEHLAHTPSEGWTLQDPPFKQVIADLEQFAEGHEALEEARSRLRVLWRRLYEPRLPSKGYHDVDEFYPPNEEE